MRNLPPVACKVDPTNESSWIISVKPRIDQGDAAVSFSVQPHGPSSKEQCEPSGRLSTTENKKKQENKRNLVMKEHKQQQKSEFIVLSKLPNLCYTFLCQNINRSHLFISRVTIRKPTFLLLEILETFQFCPGLDTVQNCSSHNLKNGKSLPYVYKDLAIYEIAGITKFSVST